METKELFQYTTKIGASDIFIIAGKPLSYRLNGVITQEDENRLMPEDTERIIHDVYELAGNRSLHTLEEDGDDDFSFSIPGISRFRVNTYKQRGSYAAVIRIITFDLPKPELIGISDNIMNFANLNRGLVLVTGPAGSGKSTTLACIIDSINKHKEKHIITLEDPLEFLHRHEKSIVSQREISTDTKSYVSALRASLRQSPDVVLLGEMRDYETIQIAMTAVETGHLIFSTLHTIGAANTIDRIIDVFPPNQQRQIALQLSMTLQAVISQQLIPTVDGNLAAAFEIMTITPAIRNMIREHKIPQIDGLVYSSASPNMISMDNSLLKLFKEGRITKETALTYSTNPDMLERKLN